MKNKKGQFYLIAATIIISLILGLFLITNSTKREERTKLYELSQELNVEAGKILQFGAVSGNYQFDDFTKNFTDYSGSDIRIVFIVGNYLNIEAYEYENGVKNTVESSINSNEISVNVEGIDYTFEIRPGENFYFVMIQEINGEKYVATNK